MTKNILSIDEIKKSVAPICQRYGVKRAYLFGSYSGNEATEHSDVDIRIEKGNLHGLTEINFVDRNEVLKLWHQKMVANNIFWR